MKFQIRKVRVPLNPKKVVVFYDVILCRHKVMSIDLILARTLRVLSKKLSGSKFEISRPSVMLLLLHNSRGLRELGRIFHEGGSPSYLGARNDKRVA